MSQPRARPLTRVRGEQLPESSNDGDESDDFVHLPASVLELLGHAWRSGPPEERGPPRSEVAVTLSTPLNLSRLPRLAQRCAPTPYHRNLRQQRHRHRGSVTDSSPRRHRLRSAPRGRAPPLPPLRHTTITTNTPGCGSFGADVCLARPPKSNPPCQARRFHSAYHRLIGRTARGVCGVRAHSVFRPARAR